MDILQHHLLRRASRASWRRRYASFSEQFVATRALLSRIARARIAHLGENNIVNQADQ